MKITKSQFKKELKEAMFDIDSWAAKLELNVSGLYSELRQVKDDVTKSFEELGEELTDSVDEIMLRLNDYLSTSKKPKEKSDVIKLGGDAGDKTNPRGMPTREEIKRMVKEELDEIKKKTKVSKVGQKRVSKKIGYLMGKEKMDPDQAAAVATQWKKEANLRKVVNIRLNSGFANYLYKDLSKEKINGNCIRYY